MNWIDDHLRQFDARPAFISNDVSHSYKDLAEAIGRWRAELASLAVAPGASVAIIGDYEPEVAALLLALIGNRNIIVPLTHETGPQHARFMALAQVRYRFDFKGGEVSFEELPPGDGHPLLARLREAEDAGIVLFTSGTTGESKGAVLRVSDLLDKHREVPADKRRPMRTAVFLKLDHIGGLNTLFATLLNGGVAIPQTDRSVAAVCRAVEKHRIELLPTTPTFLNMMLMSDPVRQHDLSSLKLITYGTEPMPLSTLNAVNQYLPGVHFKQTYGSTELGIFATKSEASSSIWLKLSGRDAEMKIANGTLWIRSNSAMLGYLNAPDPFDKEGWYDTGDQVEVNGDYIRILGRKSELINVGGEKVFPAEVESVLLEMANVRDAVVYAKSSPVTGNIVAAVMDLEAPEQRAALQKRIHAHCTGRLQEYKIPKFISVADKSLIGNRLKKIRNIA